MGNLFDTPLEEILQTPRAFFVSLFSVSIQGSFIPLIARKLNLVEEESPVAKTFNDYQEENSTQLVELTIQDDNPWANKSLEG